MLDVRERSAFSPCLSLRRQLFHLQDSYSVRSERDDTKNTHNNGGVELTLFKPESLVADCNPKRVTIQVRIVIVNGVGIVDV